MRTRILAGGAHDRTLVLVCDRGDDAVEALLAAARRYEITAASFTAIGAFSRVTLGFFDPDVHTYRRIRIDEQVEVVSLIGNIARAGREPKIHAHVVVGRADGTAYGGHLLESSVWPTLEVVLTETPAHLRRTHDEATGLPLIDVRESGPSS